MRCIQVPWCPEDQENISGKNEMWIWKHSGGGLKRKCRPSVHVLRASFIAWCYWDVVETLRHRDLPEIFQSL